MPQRGSHLPPHPHSGPRRTVLLNVLHTLVISFEPITDPPSSFLCRFHKFGCLSRELFAQGSSLSLISAGCGGGRGVRLPRSFGGGPSVCSTTEAPRLPTPFMSLEHRMELSPPKKIRIPFQVSREKLVAKLNLSSKDRIRAVAGIFENGFRRSLPPGIRAFV